MNNKIKESAGWVKGLDTLRFILALLVLLSHLENTWADTLKHSQFAILQYLGGLLGISYCGVGAVIGFFIISGFVIHYPNKTGIKDVKKFLVRRWLRIILPLLIISIIGIKINRFYFIPIWSLYCELIYYSLYPLLYKVKLSWIIKFICSFILSGLLVILLAQSDLQSFLKQREIFYSGAYWQLGTSLTWLIGLPCWLLGVVLAEKIDTYKDVVSKRKIILYRISIFLIASVLTFAKFKLFMSYVLSMNIFALPLFFWIKAEIIYAKIKEPKPQLEYLGEFSYSIYLCHNFCFFLLSFIMTLNNYTYLIFIIGTIAISYCYYLIIEKPSHKLAKYISNKF